MALVGYDSSSEEDEEVPQQVQAPEPRKVEEKRKPEEPPSVGQTSGIVPQPMEVDAEPSTPTKAQPAAPIGPSMGPSLPVDQLNDLPEPLEEPIEDDANPPLSPYSSNRAQLQNLTLPTVPDFDIPPSPSTSPPPAIDKKLQQFLDLKKKGVHFNQKLQASAAMRNPSLMDKLMGFVEMEGTEGYRTTLSDEVWDGGKGLPEWARREKLRASREKIVKEREGKVARGERTTMEFVKGK